MTRALILCNLVSIICAIGAVVAICRGEHDGWGGLLFVAAILHTTPKSPDDQGDEEEDGESMLNAAKEG